MRRVLVVKRDRKRGGVARIPKVEYDVIKPNTKSRKSSTKRGAGPKSRNGKCLVNYDSSQPGIRTYLKKTNHEINHPIIQENNFKKIKQTNHEIRGEFPWESKISI